MDSEDNEFRTGELRALRELLRTRREMLARAAEIRAWFEERGRAGAWHACTSSPAWSAYVLAQAAWEAAVAGLDEALK